MAVKKNMELGALMPTAAGQKLVRVKLFKDNGKYKSDVFVGVNGRGYQLQRGVEIDVPEEVAEVLEHSQMQDTLTSERIAKAEADAGKPITEPT